jgi:hypothetical protein
VRSRHVRQATRLYTLPRKYWLLKAISQRSGHSMQVLLRRALDDVLTEAHRSAPWR